MKTLLLVTMLALFGCASSPEKEMKDQSMKAEEMKMKAKSKMNEMKKSASDSAQALTCEIGGEKRMIEVKSEGSGCEVLYTKNGETNSIATAKYDLGYCSKIQNRIVTNLTNAGYECK